MSKFDVEVDGHKYGPSYFIDDAVHAIFVELHAQEKWDLQSDLAEALLKTRGLSEYTREHMKLNFDYDGTCDDIYDSVFNFVDMVNNG